MRRVTVTLGMILALSVPATAMAPAWADVAWTVTGAMQPKVADVLKTSPITAEMRRENEPNRPVRLLRDHAPELVMSDDLVACLHLTNPQNAMTMDSGGGFDIDIDQVTFPGGDWDVHVRIREMQKIDELDSELVLVLDKLIIGALRFIEEAKLKKALRLLTKTCFEPEG